MIKWMPGKLLCYTDFRSLKLPYPDEDIECLRSLCRQYYKLSDELTAYKNRLMGIVDQLMLNFKDVFPNIFSKAALAVLEKYPAPAHILKRTETS